MLWKVPGWPSPLLGLQVSLHQAIHNHKKDYPENAHHNRGLHHSKSPASCLFFAGLEAFLNCRSQVPHTDDVTATATATLVETETITNTETDVSTVTNYETIYTSTTAVVAIPTFKVYAIGGDNNGHPFYDIGDGRVGDDAENGVTVLEFSINSDGTLTADNGSKSGSEGETDPNAGGTDSYVMFGSSGNNLVNVVCNVLYNDDDTCPLACQGTRGTTNYDCGVYWRIGSSADVGNCFQFTPYVVGSQ